MDAPNLIRLAHALAGVSTELSTFRSLQEALGMDFAISHIPSCQTPVSKWDCFFNEVRTFGRTQDALEIVDQRWGKVPQVAALLSHSAGGLEAIEPEVRGHSTISVSVHGGNNAPIVIGSNNAVNELKAISEFVAWSRENIARTDDLQSALSQKQLSELREVMESVVASEPHEIGKLVAARQSVGRILEGALGNALGSAMYAGLPSLHHFVS
jgi:hypothetical protein